jgi:GAF domain-containing protein
MLIRIRQLLAPPVFEGDEDKTRVARMLNVILWTALAIVLTSSLSVLVTPYNRLISLLVVLGIVLPILSSLVLMRRGRVQLAGGLFSLSLLIVAAALPILSGGVHNSMVTEFMVAVCVAGLLLRGRTTFILVGLAVAISVGLALAQMNGLLPPPIMDLTNPLRSITPLVANTIMVAALLYLATSGLNEALGRARRYGAELKAQSDQLEELVQARTRDLVRRTNYLGATTAVARESAVLSDPQQLLSRVVDVISKQFGFYHTGLFLVDSAGEWAELSAASGEGGRRMLARGHRLRLGVGDAGQGIVGHVAARGESRVALDTGADAVFFDNPDLPETRSEAALPLQVRGEIIGVLDVQSTQAGAFSEEDVQVLQSLADQVAVAINSARLFQQVQGGLEAERRAYGEVSREAWGALLRARPDLGFFYKGKRGVFSVGDVEQSKEALRTRKMPGEDDATRQTIPIKVRGHVIGVIDAHKPDDAGEWMPEEITLLETLTDQLGMALESARLYQDTQRRAAREQLLGEVTARVRETLDMETVLKTAVQEVRQALGLPEVVIRLTASPPSPRTTGDGCNGDEPARSDGEERIV